MTSIGAELLLTAVALVCRGAPPDCGTLESTKVQSASPPMMAFLTVHHAFAAYNFVDKTIYVAPITSRNPELSDADELALALSHEVKHAEQDRQGEDYRTACLAMETEAFVAQGQFWSWLWNGRPPNVAYNGPENAGAMAWEGGARSLTMWDCGKQVVR